MSDGDRSNDLAPDRLRSSDARRDASRQANGCQSTEVSPQNSSISRQAPDSPPSIAQADAGLVGGRGPVRGPKGACVDTVCAALNRRMTARRLETGQETPRDPRDRDCHRRRCPQRCGTRPGSSASHTSPLNEWIATQRAYLRLIGLQHLRWVLLAEALKDLQGGAAIFARRPSLFVLPDLIWRFVDFLRVRSCLDGLARRPLPIFCNGCYSRPPVTSGIQQWHP